MSFRVAVFAVVNIIGLTSCSFGVIVNNTVELSPRLKVRLFLSTFTSIGSGMLQSRTAILFSTHSVNQILSLFMVKSSTCATPHSSIPLQSDQLGFCDGIKYSTRDSFDGSNTAMLFPACSLNHN